MEETSENNDTSDYQSPEEVDKLLHQERKNRYIIISSVCVVVLLIGGFLYLSLNKTNQENKILYRENPTISPANTDSENEEPLPLFSGEKLDSLVFLNDNHELLILDNQKTKRLIPTNRSVLNFAIPKSRNFIVYTSGIAKTLNENSEYEFSEVVPQKVYIYYPESKEEIEIVSHPADASKYRDYTQNWNELSYITGVALSNDDKTIAISSRDIIWIYNEESQELIKNDIPLNIVLEFESQSNLPFENFSDPQFSPDNSRLLLSWNMWEHGNKIIYNIASNTLTQLPESMISTGLGEEGVSPRGWLSENELLFKRWEVSAVNQGGWNKILQTGNINDMSVIDICELGENMDLFFDTTLKDIYYMDDTKLYKMNVMTCARDFISDFTNLGFSIDERNTNFSLLPQIYIIPTISDNNNRIFKIDTSKENATIEVVGEKL